MSTEEQPLPKSLGPYRVIKQIGQGGMGIVYEAVHEEISRRVAIKLLRSEYAHNSQVAQRFFNEARAANLIDHPALVQISEFGQLPDGSTYLVMELLKGENLAKRVRRAGALPLPWVLRIGCQLAEALSAAHQKGVVHRDLKPDKVMAERKTPNIVPQRGEVLANYGLRCGTVNPWAVATGQRSRELLRGAPSASTATPALSVAVNNSTRGRTVIRKQSSGSGVPRNGKTYFLLAALAVSASSPEVARRNG